jgi:hypothetical protein
VGKVVTGVVAQELEQRDKDLKEERQTVAGTNLLVEAVGLDNPVSTDQVTIQEFLEAPPEVGMARNHLLQGQLLIMPEVAGVATTAEQRKKLEEAVLAAAETALAIQARAQLARPIRVAVAVAVAVAQAAVDTAAQAAVVLSYLPIQGLL